MKSPYSGSITMFLPAIILYALPINILVQGAGKCYYADGTPSDQIDYTPCNYVQGQPYDRQDHSMCCFTGGNQTSGAPSEICLPYGLCVGGLDGNGERKLWRDTCSDPTWESPNCVRICMFDDWLNEDAPITGCADGSFCCGEGNSTCCEKKQGTFLTARINPPPYTSSSSHSPSSTSSELIFTFTFESSSGFRPIPYPTSSGGISKPTYSDEEPSARVTGADFPPSSSGSAQPGSQPSAAGQTIKVAIGVGVTAITIVVMACVFGGVVYFRRRRSKPEIDPKGINAPNIHSAPLDAQIQDSRRKSHARTIVGGELPTSYNTQYIQEFHNARGGNMYEMM